MEVKVTPEECAKISEERGEKHKDLFIYQDEQVVIFKGVAFICYCFEEKWSYFSVVGTWPFEGYLFLFETEVPDDFKDLKQEALEQIALSQESTVEELCEKTRSVLSFCNSINKFVEDSDF